jgi:hypothetical protein
VIVHAGDGAVPVHVHRAHRHDPVRPATLGELTELARLRRSGAAGEGVDERLGRPPVHRAPGVQQLVARPVQVLDVGQPGRLVRAGVRDGHGVARGKQMRQRRLADRPGPADENHAHQEPPPAASCTGGMTRILATLLAVGLVLAPAAVAKGPHAILKSGPDAAAPGEPWKATIEMYEFTETPRPVVMATRGKRRVAAQVRATPARMDESRFNVRAVFPTAGRWRLTMVSGKKSFSFAAISVGSGVVPQDYVAFPEGSEAARQGAGGVYLEEEPAASGGGGALPPENLSIATAEADDEDDGGGIAPWLFPLLGVVLAGAGVATLRARR